MPGAFQFRLARLKRLRELEEARARAVLAAAGGRERDARDRLESATAQRTLHRAELARRRSTQLDAQAEMLAERTLVQLDAQINDAREALDRAVRETELAQQGYTQAKQDSGALERMEERQRADWSAEQMRAEANEADERTLARRDFAAREDLRRKRA